MATTPQPRPARWPFRVFVGLCLVALLTAGGLLWAYHYRNGEALARLVMDAANANLRGRLHFGSLHWTPRAIVDLALGTATPAEVRDFAIHDPRGTRVVHVPHATARIELLPLITGAELRIRDIKVCGRADVLIEELPAEGEETEIGIAAAFGSRDSSSSSDERGLQLLFADSFVQQCRVRLAFGGFSLVAEDIQAQVERVHFRGGDIEAEGIDLQARASGSSGAMTIGGERMALSEIRIERVHSPGDRLHDLQVRLVARVSGARTRLEANLVDLYRPRRRVKATLSVNEAGPLLQRLTDELLSGPAQVALRVAGPLEAPRAEGRFSGVKLELGEVGSARLKGQVVFDAGREAITVSGVDAVLLGGRARGAAAVDFAEQHWRASLQLEGVNPGRVEPRIAGRLDGEVSFGGRLGSGNQGVIVTDVVLERDERRDLLPRRIEVKGTAHLSPPLVDFAGMTVSAEGASAVLRGSVNLADARSDLRVRLSAPRLAQLLVRRGLPAVARAASAGVHVTGRWPTLRASGELTADSVGHGGVRLPRVTARLALDRGTLRLDDIRGDGHGGRVVGAASLQLFAGTLARPLERPLLLAQLKARDVALARLIGGMLHRDAAAGASGRVSGEVTIKGPLEALTGTGSLRASDLELAGDRYREARASFGLLADRLTIYRGELRRAAGGRLRAWGDLFFDGRLALRTEARQLPLEAVPGVAAIPLGIGGIVDGKVRIDGSLAEPRLDGALGISGARFRGMDLGQGTVKLTPGSDIVRVTGALFDRRVTVDGFMMMRPVPRIHLRADVTGFPLERVLPEIGALGDVRATASGQVQLDADARRGLSWASARMSRVSLALHHRPPGARQTRVVELANSEPLVARYGGDRLHLVSARLLTSVDGARLPGDFTLGGWLSGDDSDLWLRGKVALELAEFFLARRIQRLSGFVRANLQVVGPLDQARFAGRLALDRVALSMPGFDRALEVPRGVIELSPGKLELRRLPLLVEGQRLTATGKILLDGLRMPAADLSIGGDFNVRLLRLVLPEQLSHAAGSAGVRLSLQGPLDNPQVRGRLEVKRVELVPRATGRALSLTRGGLVFNGYLIKTIEPLEGFYDEGRVSIGGRVRLDAWEPVDIAVDVTGSAIAAREPRVYLAEANVRLKLVGEVEALMLSGEVDLIDARYIREFDIVKNALLQPRTSEEDRPFWQGSRTLENLALKLIVRSTGPLTVKNRYADLSLDGTLAVGGTLADPRIDGQVRLEEGRFRIPFLHGEYTLDRGEIVFDSKLPAEQAQLDIVAENRVQQGAEEYLIKLQLKGPLANVRLGLTSEPPLEPGQIATLLATGRTTDQLRSQLRGDAGGGAAGAADAQVKQLTGDLLGNIVEDQIRRVVRLDLFRLELGTESVGLRACKRFGRYLENCVNWEKGLIGDEQRAEVTGEAKMHDYLRLVGRAEKLTERIETEDENSTRLRLELKVRLRLR